KRQNLKFWLVLHFWKIRRRESNPHRAKLRQILSLLRLPVPPLRAKNQNSTSGRCTQAFELLPRRAYRSYTLRALDRNFEHTDHPPAPRRRVSTILRHMLTELIEFCFLS